MKLTTLITIALALASVAAYGQTHPQADATQAVTPEAYPTIMRTLTPPVETIEHRTARNEYDRTVKTAQEWLEHWLPVFKMYQTTAANKSLPNNVRRAAQDGVATMNQSVGQWNALIKKRKAQMDIADACAALYTNTVDKKTGDLTTRETEQINACKNLDSYSRAVEP